MGSVGWLLYYDFAVIFFDCYIWCVRDWLFAAVLLLLHLFIFSWLTVCGLGVLRVAWFGFG